MPAQDVCSNGLQGNTATVAHLVSPNASYQVVVRWIIRIECHAIDWLAMVFFYPVIYSSSDGEVVPAAYPSSLTRSGDVAHVLALVYLRVMVM